MSSETSWLLMDINKNRFECAWTAALNNKSTEDVFAILSLLRQKRRRFVVAGIVGSTSDADDRGTERHLRVGAASVGRTRSKTPCDQVINDVVYPVHKRVAYP